MTLISVIISFTCMISSCKKESRWDCSKRSGEKTTDTRILSSFTKIYLDDNVNVFITQGSSHEVKVEAGKNLLSLIKTEVIDGELHIENNNRCNWARSYKNGAINVYVTIPVLRKISHYGTGLIKSNDTIICDSLTILTHESGDVDLSIKANLVYSQIHSTSDATLRGTTLLHGIYHAGEGYLYYHDLIANQTFAHSEASGNEYLNVKDVLSVVLNWAGDIYYSGNPQVNIVGNNGEGKLIHQN